jgi:P-type Ca2+ transporter type 2C
MNLKTKDWHALAKLHVLEYLDSRVTGLTSKESEERINKYGLNKISIEKKRSKLLLFLSQFNNPIIYILIAAAIITIFIEDISDAIVIMVATFLNATIGFIQEMKSDDAMKALAKMAALKARVKRAGHEIIVDSETIVPGDIVLLESGTKLPADVRLIESNNLSIDESMLTGESIHVQKHSEIIEGSEIPLAEKNNMAFSGTIVTRGRGIGVVVATGRHTEFGKIAKMISEQEQALSPLQIRINQFGKYLTFSIVAIIAIIFLLGYFIRHIPLQEMALTAVGLAVSAIPEGLPVAITVTLSIGLYKMAKRNAIIRRLPAVETLGSTTIICSDKTGTLTKNEMTVQEIYAGRRLFTITGSGYFPVGEFLLDGVNINPFEYRDLFMTLSIGSICTESKLEVDKDRYKVIGDPTEGALLTAALKANVKNSEYHNYTIVNEIIPFESENQYMASLIVNKGKFYIYMKGSVEKILQNCDRELINGNYNEVDTENLKKTADRMAGKGLRVLAHALKPLDKPPDKFTEADITPGFAFAGFQAMMDPPREEVSEAIKNCHLSGIKVMMITGDHQKTAEVIARKLGLSGSDKVNVMTGKELDTIDDDELFKKVNDINVFARVSPTHKLRIVNQLKRVGHITAMTGDGVNDAPALKSADIGVSMGSGTDVAKEASSMIVADDNFATISKAIEHGRKIYNNLQNILLFVLTTSMGGILTILTSILAGFPLPFLPVQILWINLVTDGTSTVPLAFEEGDKNVMQQKPRDPKNPIITKKMAIRLLVNAVFMTIIVLAIFIFEYSNENYIADKEYRIKYARTIAFTAFAFMQMVNAHNCRSQIKSLFSIGLFKNKSLLLVHSISLTLQILIIHTYAGNEAFTTVPLNFRFNGWIVIILASLSVFLFSEAIKLIERKKLKATGN